MADQENNLTGAGKAIMYTCMIVAIVGAMALMNALAYRGAIPGALFGGVGGLVGGMAGYGLAYLTGNVVKDQL